tara:strand:- start:588 stop:986 length:399 start_codon:yes stop_codon:yes gene_type:complete
MKRILLITFLLILNLLNLNPLSSREKIEDINLIEKVSFNVWWENKYNDSVITLRTYPDNIKTIQVGNGRSIRKNQVLEIYKDFDKSSFFSKSLYIFNIVYKDENSKVSTGKIIFDNKKASNVFEKALIDFGF